MQSHHQPPGMPSHHQPGMPSRRHSSGRRSRPTRILAGVTALATLALAGCSLGGAAAPSTATNPPVRCGAVTEVLLVTHDSFALSEQERARFTALTGCTLTVLASGDAGALTNKLVLTKSSPIGDAVFGIDNTFASRAASEGVLADVSPALPSGAAIHALSGPAAAKLAPIDYGDVCVNVDLAWFAAKSLPLPATLDDLIQPAYRGLFVTPGATTSSPGLAFLLATIGAKGEGWQDYWRALMANDTKLTSGWSDAYAVDFSGGEGKGSRPIVLSYASSPPFTIPQGAAAPTTKALLDTCFRQVEYAGVLVGARNPEGARAFVQFMLSAQVQASIPDAMYMFPVDPAVQLPADWARWAAVSPRPFTVAPEQIAAQRDTWLRQWSEVTSR